ncbi:AcrR family transcriptional regulator [Saccharopolyspora lacisalsi]|uniref:AcrR family transcriptional regulator n=1 Tax=Halosaccharopolyspora lacisalsi TaxID=1000566 RepID=A0A839E842_9PSEU|nr:TetR/AcrR family transcriptional regulator [Halosaccharopolyspora lacisalsi]MBA8827441.1 AcrR family transcriptional regulator [Halosaccharopolyspora lacisalsi]
MPDRKQLPDSRADRILDAAGELLLRLGHRKVTIADVAKQARIGKGTVYLHWRTKDLLFQALLARESVELLDEALAELRRDPSEVRPHRLMRTMFLATERRPLVKALLTGDMEMLGSLADSQLGRQDAVSNAEYFASMTRHGLLRTDVAHLDYTMNAALTGFFVIDGLQPAADVPDVEARADGLAHTVRYAFEPQGQPDPDALAAAAAEVTAVFEEMSSNLGQWIYSHDPAPRSD